MCMQYVYVCIKGIKGVKQNPVELEYQNISESRVKNYTGD